MQAVLVVLVLVVVFGAIWLAIRGERSRSSPYIPMHPGVWDSGDVGHHGSHHVDHGGSLDAGSDCGGDFGGGDCS